MNFRNIAKRISFYLMVGLTVYVLTSYYNRQKLAAATALPAAEQFVPTPIEPVEESTPEESTQTKLDNLRALTNEISDNIPVAEHPIIEDQTEDDRILLHLEDMSSDEVSVTNEVARVVIDDYTALRKVSLRDVSISDRYRVVNPQDEAEYGMGEYEYVLHYKNRCEIAEVSVNYRNNYDARVLGYRRC